MNDHEKGLALEAADDAFKEEMTQLAKNAALLGTEDRDLLLSVDRIVNARRRFCALLGLQA